MAWFANLSMRQKLSLAFGSVLAIMLACGLFSLVEMAKINTSMMGMTGKWEGVKDVAVIRADINALRPAELSWLLAPSEQESAKYESEIDAILKKTRDHMAKYEPSITLEEDRQLYRKFQTDFQQYLGLHDQIRSLHQAGRDSAASSLALDQGTTALNGIQNDIVQVINAKYQRADADKAQVTSEYTRSRTSIVVLLAAALAAGALLTVLVSSKVATPLGRLVASFNRGAEGDLRVRVQVDGKDEVGQVSHGFNTFMERLQETIQRVTASSHQLAGASEEISAAAAQSAQGAKTQQNQASQIATAIAQMAATIAQVSENCRTAAQKARESAAEARDGGKAVDHTGVMMCDLAESVEKVGSQISELGKRSDQIGHIIGVIDDIADQTNLLALNAAIEAARAGEQGRGFAVVADEVRKLAERTGKATKEITEMITAVQQETRAAVEAMKRGTAQVEKGVQATNEAGETLRHIIAGSEAGADMIAQIATTANQQAAATDQINENVGEIAKITEQAVAGAQQSAKACEDLSNLALELQTLVSRFQVENGGSGTRFQPVVRAQKRTPARTDTRVGGTEADGHGAVSPYQDQAASVQ
jgi:methyl-accepting chemotaxis protein